MSDSDIKQARERTREAGQRFDVALDQLAGRLEDGAGMIRGLGNELTHAASTLGEELKERILEPLGGYLDETGPRAEKAFQDLRMSAEAQITRMDQRPLAAWMTVFLGGFFLGMIAIQGTRSRRSDVSPIPKTMPLH